MEDKKVKKEEIQEAEVITTIEDVKSPDSNIVSLEVKDETALTEHQKGAIGKLDDFNSVSEMLDFATVLVDSKIVPFSKPEQVVTVVLQAKELGLGAVTGLYNLYYIEGKPSLSIHCIGALLQRDGIAWKTLEDAVYIDKHGDVLKNREGHVDVRTTIRFYKMWNGIPIEEDVSFTWKDAIKAELDKKSNWSKYPKSMLYNRCYAIGARRVSPKSLMGIMEVTEMADVANMDYKLDSETGHLSVK